MSRKKITIIGGGISSLSAASFLAQAGHEVQIIEKNETIGGRARQFKQDGFVFDMGPSWYWMPDVFEEFFNKFGKKASDYYDLVRLDPSYRIFWEDNSSTDIPANMTELEALFESLEPGSSIQLKKFLKEAEYKYKVGMKDLVFKPGLSLLEFADLRILKGLMSMHLTQSFSKYIRKHFTHPKILSLLEFPVLFLGAMPSETPALYSLMNFADLKLGTWYPMGGMHKIIEAFEKVAIEQGVKIITGNEVLSTQAENGTITSITCKNGEVTSDIFISGADYEHTDQKLLKENSNYDEKYWDNRTMAPSCLLFYVGLNRKVDNLKHHNLFFDTPFHQHAIEIYKDPQWPSSPLFYVCCPSKTDPNVAPEGYENMFLLIPLAPNLKDDESKREEYFELLLRRIKARTGEDLKPNIVFKRSYCIDDFKADYHAFKGNAYGLANTLMQTAILKPKLKSKKLSNFYFTGQLTVPGPGVPPSIISGEVVANEIIKDIAK
ncbi:MAG: phytoene desaturase [Lentimonas sp.]|jgi:phytoene desaturase